MSELTVYSTETIANNILSNINLTFLRCNNFLLTQRKKYTFVAMTKIVVDSPKYNSTQVKINLKTE